MKQSAIFVFAIFYFVSVVTGELCHDFSWGTPTMTIKEIVHLNLEINGPADGECGDKDKWNLLGDVFALDSKCVCLDHPKGEGKNSFFQPSAKSLKIHVFADIKPNEGLQCPDFLLAHRNETFKEAWLRNYEALVDIAPADGWCKPGQTKWIQKGDTIDKPKDICYCVYGHEFVSDAE